MEASRTLRGLQPASKNHSHRSRRGRALMSSITALYCLSRKWKHKLSPTRRPQSHQSPQTTQTAATFTDHSPSWPFTLQHNRLTQAKAAAQRKTHRTTPYTTISCQNSTGKTRDSTKHLWHSTVDLPINWKTGKWPIITKWKWMIMAALLGEFVYLI